MAVLKTVARRTVKLLLGLFLLVTALYLILLVINWQDAKPNADSLHMQSLLQQDAIPAEQNGYHYYLAHNAKNELLLSGPLEELYRQCNEAEACKASLNAETDLAAQVAEQHQLMAFYRQLLQYPQWQEPPPTIQSIPAYQGLLHGQRLFLWQTWLEAQNGNIEQVNAALQADYQFWHTVLTNSNSLITKMVSSGALKHHFQFAPDIIKQLPKEQRPAAVPAAWASALSDKALSLELVMAGEWHYGSDIIYSAWKDIPPSEAGDSSVSEMLLVWLSRPLWLPEDTKNIRATQLLQLQQDEAHQPASATWYSWLRNPVGKLFMATGTVTYTDYQQRLLKLEQQRQDVLQNLS
ncbi:MAG: hypothetical protein CML20_01700 [Rheinheimera sp.]|uniref:hypothetical protein n=1 Tax=Arsukibacterium sp. UBA3155 TaxID=1946058 RepID=UPI000C97B0F8|nr:hypothetical protein [Arsukibacterium sp. UBA3155]MAD73515.1 hypothetical protein [Rheinheimera sp.]|tara:strand:- start:58674 stop:59726 length:1053 start_codon:yes stop_codon:yes gene_type:complete